MQNSKANRQKFIKEVTKYFMDFLETDFHKRKHPKRGIKYKNSENLLVGINLNKYTSFNPTIWKLISQSFKTNTLNKIRKERFKTDIPKNLIELIKAQVSKVTQKTINKIIKSISKELENNVHLFNKEFNKALNHSLKASEKIIKKQLTLPLIKSIEKSLEQLSLADENTIYLMEEELSTIFKEVIKGKISEIIKKLIIKEKVIISKEIEKVFSLNDTKNSLNNFFENFKVTDLYSELYEIERNKNILDKQEFYLYFCDITFNRAKYPIFYIPFNLEKEGNHLVASFDSQVYINKKALEYIAQEFNREKGQKGSLKTVSERIIYLADYSDNFLDFISKTVNELTDFFELDRKIDLFNHEPQVAKSLLVRISNNCHINLFDKSDEALVNDYEDILKLLDSEDSIIGSAFNKLIEDFIFNNPKPHTIEIQDEWENLETGEKLVYKSPIPLNREQQQILKAIDKKDCNYITVEGPPGTGKSHTITAIVFESILKNQSILVLSDKKEALDVVENKITETMNKVRHDKSFQNPVLRLGKTGNTYSQILSANSMTNIKDHFRAVRNDYKQLEENIDKSVNSLKEDILAETISGSEVNLQEVQEFHKLASSISKSKKIIDSDELSKHLDSCIDIEEFRKILFKFRKIFKTKEVDPRNNFNIYNIFPKEIKSIESLKKNLDLASLIIDNAENLKRIYKDKVKLLNQFDSFSNKDLNKLNMFIQKYDKLRTALLGFLFKAKQVDALNIEFKQSFPASLIDEPHKQLDNLKTISEILTYAKKFNNDNKHFSHSRKDICEGDCPNCSTPLIFSDEDRKDRKIICPECKSNFKITNSLNRKYERFHFTKKRGQRIDELKENDAFDYLNIITKLLLTNTAKDKQSELDSIHRDLNILIKFTEKYPKTTQAAKIKTSNFKSILENLMTELSNFEFDNLIRFINLQNKIIKNFNGIPEIKYTAQKRNLEKLVTTQMTHIMDETVIKFFENTPATAKTLRDIIKNKKRFPKNEFNKLKQAFPCILAGIRDYAEYIPLKPNSFDLVVIDEASQVSIAQAFPALLRAKKIVIFGDKKQFSNIKAAQARSETNIEYRRNLKRNFKRLISKEEQDLTRLEKFNIKTSILEFFEFIANFNIQLRKHFRGYKELISYSNKFFYTDTLQVMKIRGNPITETLKFSTIPHDNKLELIHNSNSLEAEFIISQLKKIKESGQNLSVGIITPHTNQQKLLVEKISRLVEKDYFFNELKLKIMTFDTCQGEERDLIFYSMVATEENDRLWGVFIKDLSKVNLEENGQIKAQRLNVGLSRSKEQMHFVLSKSIDKYNGSIGEALRHYQSTLEDAKKEPTVNQVDQKSPMEKKILQWLMQTDFYKNNKKNVEIKAQFPLGEYLKQLNKRYVHPNYVVDFLIIFNDKLGVEHKIILEYDGFEYHFNKDEDINEFNYDLYYTEEDVYRQKTLEGYGYKFIRVNRFNLMNNEIVRLNEKLVYTTSKGVDQNHLLDNIHKTVEGLKNGSIKECPKCKEVKNLQEFKDNSLISGYGRFCNQCKGGRYVAQRKYTLINDDEKKLCPKCGAEMILRTGRYGKFYGCTKFPYCRGTRQFN